MIGKLKVNGLKKQLLKDRAHTGRLPQHATSQGFGNDNEAEQTQPKHCQKQKHRAGGGVGGRDIKLSHERRLKPQVY